MTEIVSLTDNISASKELKAKHGLSFYIETPKHKILFDLGQDETFLYNAKKLGVDLSKVDTVIISHGHYDHGGGLGAFIKLNTDAKIYIRRSAFEPYYSKGSGEWKYIGLDGASAVNPKIIFTEEVCPIDGELFLFSGVTERKLFSGANGNLFVKRDEKMLPDGFEHEQYLIVHGEGKQVLITGCSHAGIVNIAEKFNRNYRSESDVTVIGGFHLYDNAGVKYEEDETVYAVADELNRLGDRFYTCHCTGEKACKKMKNIMQNRLQYFAVGNKIVL